MLRAGAACGFRSLCFQSAVAGTAQDYARCLMHVLGESPLDKLLRPHQICRFSIGQLLQAQANTRLGICVLCVRVRIIERILAAASR